MTVKTFSFFENENNGRPLWKCQCSASENVVVVIIKQIKVEKKLLHVRLCRIGTPCLVSRLSSDTLVQSKHCESKEDFLFDPHKFTRSVWRLPSLRESRCFPQTPSTLFTLPAQRIISLISSSLLRKFPKSSFSWHLPLRGLPLYPRWGRTSITRKKLAMVIFWFSTTKI